MIEAELKARVTDPESLRARLTAAAGEPERAVYADVYFDRHGELVEEQRELRVRTITTDRGERTVLTYKGRVVDEETGSKPEAETVVADRRQILAILEGLGYACVIEFSKHCENYRLATPAGRKVLATVVQVPELEGVFLEVETMVADEQDVPDALDDLRALLLDLELGPETLTTELYTQAVRAQRFMWKPGDVVWLD
jgi:adenylate cyclase class 2